MNRARAAAASVLCLLCFACGGDDDTPTSTADPVATSTTEGAEPSAPSASLGDYECPTPAEVAGASGHAESDVPLEAGESNDDDGVDQSTVHLCRYDIQVRANIEYWTSPEGAARGLFVDKQVAVQIDPAGLGDDAWLETIDSKARLYVRRGSVYIGISYDGHLLGETDPAVLEAKARALFALFSERVQA